MTDSNEPQLKRQHLAMTHHDDDKSDNSDAKDIVSILNDFCLLEIFNKLNINDLCCMVNVSKQFKRISMMSFAARYKSFYYPNEILPCIDRIDIKSKMRRVLCNFGHLIQSLKLRDFQPAGIFSGPKFYPIEMNAISKYCAETLKVLKLNIFGSLDCDLAKPFASLNTLKINCNTFRGDANAFFKGCENLKIFKIKQAPSTEFVSEFAQTYPNLEELLIATISLNVDTATTLLQLNPQIKKLQLFDGRANQIICPVAWKLENLEHLILDYPLNDHENIAELGKLKSLKVLERLTWFDCPTNMEFMNSILELKTLKCLTLRTISSPFDNFFKKLPEQLPQLTDLELGFKHQAERLFSIKGLSSFIDRTPHLSIIAIHTNHSDIFNQKFYDSMLPVVRKRSDSKRLTIKVYGMTSTLLLMQSDLLHLEFFYEECDCSYCEPSLEDHGGDFDEDVDYDDW